MSCTHAEQGDTESHQPKDTTSWWVPDGATQWLLTFQRKELSKRLAKEAKEISNSGAVSREEGVSVAPTSGRGARPQGLLCAFQPLVNLHTSPYPIPPV